MSTLITLFIISLVGLIVLIGLRILEIRKQKQIVSDSVRFCADDFLVKMGLAIKRIIDKIKNRVAQTNFTVLRNAKIVLIKIWHKIRDKVDAYFKKLHDSLHLHRNHNNKKGAVSLYWKSVSEYKDKTSE